MKGCCSRTIFLDPSRTFISPTASMISWSVVMMVIKVRVRVTVRLRWTMVIRMEITRIT